MERQSFINHISNNQKVSYNNKNYIPVAYTLRLKDNTWLHQVELKDLKANSIIIVDLGKVDEAINE